MRQVPFVECNGHRTRQRRLCDADRRPARRTPCSATIGRPDGHEARSSSRSPRCAGGGVDLGDVPYSASARLPTTTRRLRRCRDVAATSPTAVCRHAALPPLLLARMANQWRRIMSTAAAAEMRCCTPHSAAATSHLTHAAQCGRRFAPHTRRSRVAARRRSRRTPPSTWAARRRSSICCCCTSPLHTADRRSADRSVGA